jgi:hypothetical protein
MYPFFAKIVIFLSPKGRQSDRLDFHFNDRTENLPFLTSIFAHRKIAATNAKKISFLICNSLENLSRDLIQQTSSSKTKY